MGMMLSIYISKVMAEHLLQIATPQPSSYLKAVLGTTAPEQISEAENRKTGPDAYCRQCLGVYRSADGDHIYVWHDKGEARHQAPFNLVVKSLTSAHMNQ